MAYALFAPYYLSFYGAWLTRLAQGGGLPVEALNSPDMRRMQSLLQLFNIAQFFVVAVLYCAAFRAVLHPERSSFAYLRIGAAELFVVILSIAAFIALVIGMVVVILPVSVVAALVAMGGHAGALGVMTAIPIALLIVVVAALFVGLRFSLVGPMMVEDGKFHLFDTWTLTRGRLASLLLVGLGLFGIVLLLEVVSLALVLGVAAAVVSGIGGLGPAAALLRQSPQAFLGKLAPVLVLYAVIRVPMAGCVIAIAGAPWARAYHDVAAAPAAETFA